MTQRRSSKPIPPRGPLFGWSHPGETVAEEMATRGLTAAGFAAELGCPVAELEGLLAGTLPVMLALAAALEQAWSAEAEFWMRLQSTTTKPSTGGARPGIPLPPAPLPPAIRSCGSFL